MTWLSGRHLPAHYAVLVRYLVVVVRENRRTNSELSSGLLPILSGVRGNGKQRYSELPELPMVLQVNYLLQTSVSARAHTEIQKDRLLASEVIQRNAVAEGGRKTEGRRWVAFRDDAVAPAYDARSVLAPPSTAGREERDDTQQDQKQTLHCSDTHLTLSPAELHGPD
jgi:hypothetical protein